MCEYCEEGKDLAVTLEMKIDENTITVKHGYDGDEKYTEFVGINYCPMCGESLNTLE